MSQLYEDTLKWMRDQARGNGIQLKAYQESQKRENPAFTAWSDPLKSVKITPFPKKVYHPPSERNATEYKLAVDNELNRLRSIAEDDARHGVDNQSTLDLLKHQLNETGDAAILTKIKNEDDHKVRTIISRIKFPNIGKNTKELLLKAVKFLDEKESWTLSHARPEDIKKSLESGEQTAAGMLNIGGVNDPLTAQSLLQATSRQVRPQPPPELFEALKEEALDDASKQERELQVAKTRAEKQNIIDRQILADRVVNKEEENKQLRREAIMNIENDSSAIIPKELEQEVPPIETKRSSVPIPPPMQEFHELKPTARSRISADELKSAVLKQVSSIDILKKIARKMNKDRDVFQYPEGRVELYDLKGKKIPLSTSKPRFNPADLLQVRLKPTKRGDVSSRIAEPSLLEKTRNDYLKSKLRGRRAQIDSEDEDENEGDTVGTGLRRKSKNEKAKYRLRVLKGEIGAGNNNKGLKKQIESIRNTIMNSKK